MRFVSSIPLSLLLLLQGAVTAVARQKIRVVYAGFGRTGNHFLGHALGETVTAIGFSRLDFKHCFVVPPFQLYVDKAFNSGSSVLRSTILASFGDAVAGAEF
jgi:hypothetical protein